MATTTTTTATPTAAQRFAAHDVQRRCARGGLTMMTAALSNAAYADGFPVSYTDEAVRVGRALIVAVATGDTESAANHAAAVHAALANGTWYA